MDPNEDAETCLTIIQDADDIIIEDNSDISHEILVEDCTVEIQSSEVDYCPPYVEQTIELDTENEILEETQEDHNGIQLIPEEIIIKEEVLDEQEIITDEFLIPTAECEVEIDQDYQFECVYVKEEENEDSVEMVEEEHLINEEEEVSLTDDLIYCHICETHFPNKTVLREHMLMHTKYKCAICKSIFDNSEQLAKHMRKEHPTNGNFYACTLCDKIFKRKFNLQYHLVQHQLSSFNNVSSTTSSTTSHSNNTEYSCHFCHRNLSSKQSLFMHMNTVHTNEGGYECSYCGKRFFWKSYLDRHVTVHTKEKRHHCSYCTKAFTRKLALRKHMATHNEIKVPHAN